MEEAGTPPAHVPVDQRKTSKLAIAALILAIVPTCVGQLTAIGLAIGSLVAIRKPENRLKGTGIAIAGLVIAGLWLIIFPLIAILVGILVKIRALH